MNMYQNKPPCSLAVEPAPDASSSVALGSENVLGNSRDEFVGITKPAIFQRGESRSENPTVNTQEIQAETIITLKNIGQFIEYIKTQPIIFHGTNKQHLDSILERGINRESAPVNESNWPEFRRICHEVLGDKSYEVPGLDLDIKDRTGERVFGTGQFWTAASYAMRTVGEAGHRMLLTIPGLLERSDLPEKSRSILENIQTSLEPLAKEHAPVVIKIGGGALDFVEDYQHYRKDDIPPAVAFVYNAIRLHQNPTAEDLIDTIRDMVGVNTAFLRIKPKDIIGFIDQVDNEEKLVRPENI